jgi:hypothetical protein
LPEPPTEGFVAALTPAAEAVAPELGPPDWKAPDELEAVLPPPSCAAPVEPAAEFPLPPNPAPVASRACLPAAVPETDGLVCV